MVLAAVGLLPAVSSLIFLSNSSQILELLVTGTKGGPTKDVGSVTGERQRNWEPVNERGPWTPERNEMRAGE
jgi:hypothetical protein